MKPDNYLHINTDTQQLDWIQSGEVVVSYPVSTGAEGLGEHISTHKTPRGWHQVRAKIGHHAVKNSVFVGRRATGEIYSPELANRYPDRDWILTRILWLSGLEKGFNRLGHVDTFRRFIYIHGTPDETPLGVPLSHGCVRMHGDHLVELFNQVPIGCHVFIGPRVKELR